MSRSPLASSGRLQTTVRFLGDAYGRVHLTLAFLGFGCLFGDDVGEFRDFDFGESTAEAEDSGSAGVDDSNVDVFELCA